MAIPGTLAVMAGSASIIAIMRGAERVWSAEEEWVPPDPAEVTVVRPAAHTTWTNPPVPAWTAPSGWANPDPLWADVSGFFVMGRLGMDQSEHGHPADWVSDAIPSPDAMGSVTLQSTGGLATATLSALWCSPALTVEVYGLTPAPGIVVAASDASVRWSLGWTGSGWQVAIAGMAQEIADPGANWPADVALVVSAGLASVYRDGALVGSAAVASLPSVSTRLSIGGDLVAANWSAHELSSVRITAAARYPGPYTPSRPVLSGAARLGGAGIVGYGAWTWYNDDRAIGAAGKLLFGVTTKIGMVHAYDPATARCRISRMPAWNTRDDHNNPGFLTRTDGRQLIIGTGHNINPFYRAISSEPGRVDDLSWADIGTQIGLSKYSYSNIHQLDGLPGAPIFQFGRTASPWRIYLARSDDGGASWSFVGDLVAGTGQRPYLKTVKTGPRRIDIFTSLAHPRDGNPSLRHLYFDGSMFRDAAGNPLAAPGTFPLDFGLATELWSTATDGLNSWTGALTLIGRKLVAWGYAYKASSGVGDYGHYLRYVLDLDEDPLVWRGEYVCDAGNALYAGEQHYSGGICSHPRDVDRAFASINHSGREFQIVELQRGSNGAWTVTQQITDTPSGVRNFRPYAARDPDMLLWVTGRYATYTNYTCGIAALPLERP